MAIKTVVYKLAGMRKAQEFVVYPHNPLTDDANAITVQSDRAIGRFDYETGKGVLNWRGSNSKYGPHLQKALGAEDYTFPMEFVWKCLDAEPKSGDAIGGGVYIL